MNNLAGGHGQLSCRFKMLIRWVKADGRRGFCGCTGTPDAFAVGNMPPYIRYAALQQAGRRHADGAG